MVIILPLVILPITIELLSSKNNPSVELTNSWKWTCPSLPRTKAPLLHFLDSDTAVLIPVIFVILVSPCSLTTILYTSYKYIYLTIIIQWISVYT